MNALRIAGRQQLRVQSSSPARRNASTISVVSHTSSETALPLSNIESQWIKLSKEEKASIYSQVAEIQKKDWKGLTSDEKRAAYYVAFGPHGPRTPLNPPGTALKVFGATVGVIAVTSLFYAGVRSFAAPPPRTMTKEWQEASMELARENKINPITGLSSEGFKGPGFVQSK